MEGRNGLAGRERGEIAFGDMYVVLCLAVAEERTRVRGASEGKSPVLRNLGGEEA